MFIRLWTYRVAPERAAAFEKFEREVGLPMVLGQPGCQGAEFFRRQPLGSEAASDQAEYIMISRWPGQTELETALASQVWRDEVALFQAQHFNDTPGTVAHFELI